MKKFSSNKDINVYIKKLMTAGWSFKRRRKHSCIIYERGGKISIPSTPSDRRAFNNFKKDTIRLMESSNA
jgi:hypothetical protein